MLQRVRNWNPFNPTVRFYRGIHLTRSEFAEIDRDGLVANAIRFYGVDGVQKYLQDRVGERMKPPPKLDIRKHGYRQVPILASHMTDNFSFVAPWFTTDPNDAIRYALGITNPVQNTRGKGAYVLILPVEKREIFISRDHMPAKSHHKIFLHGHDAQWLDPRVGRDEFEIKYLRPYLDAFAPYHEKQEALDATSELLSIEMGLK